MKIIALVSGWKDDEGFVFTEQADEITIREFSFIAYLTKLLELAHCTVMSSQEDLLFELRLEKGDKTVTVSKIWLSELQAI